MKNISVSPNVLFNELDGEVVLLDLDTEQYFGLDDIGSAMWLLIEEHKNQDRVVEEICKAYDVDKAKATRDVENLLAQLADANLVALDQ